MPAIGDRAPAFTLEDTSGTPHQLDGAPATVVVFTCNHCPYALAWHQRIVDVATDYAAAGVRVLAVNPNDAERYPRDSAAEMRARVERGEFEGVPYLRDESQQVARAYDAVCTPEFYGYDANLILRYRGRLDASRKDPIPDARRELFEAMQQIAQTGAGPDVQNPAFGCSIKWKID